MKIDQSRTRILGMESSVPMKSRNYNLMYVLRQAVVNGILTDITPDSASLVNMGDTIMSERNSYVGVSQANPIGYMRSPAFSTYEGCTEVTVLDALTLMVEVYDGDSLTGGRTTRRFTWVLTGDWLSLENQALAECVNTAWDLHVYREYQAKEQARQDAELAALSSEMLGAVLRTNHSGV